MANSCAPRAAFPPTPGLPEELLLDELLLDDELLLEEPVPDDEPLLLEEPSSGLPQAASNAPNEAAIRVRYIIIHPYCAPLGFLQASTMALLFIPEHDIREIQ